MQRLLTLIVACAALLAVAPATTLGSAGCEPGADWGTLRPELASQVVALVNRYRESRGLRPFLVSPAATASSEWKSLHMARFAYFGHQDPAPPEARDGFTRTRECGFQGSHWGENIAYGYPTPEVVVRGWIESDGHRANLESSEFTTIGVGVAANGSGTLYWTQTFGDDTAAAVEPGRSASPTPKTRRRRVAARSDRLVVSSPFAPKSDTHGGDTTVECEAQIDGRLLQVRGGTYRRGRATCAWRMPAGMSGRQVVGAIVVRQAGAARIRLFTRVVR